MIQNAALEARNTVAQPGRAGSTASPEAQHRRCGTSPGWLKPRRTEILLWSHPLRIPTV
jgi:hypothetical protein